MTVFVGLLFGVGISNGSEIRVACNCIAIAVENIDVKAWIEAGKTALSPIRDRHVVFGHAFEFVVLRQIVFVAAQGGV
jgi:hypothetical protein